MNRFQRLAAPILRHLAAGKPATPKIQRQAAGALFLVGKATSKSKGGRLRRIGPPGATTKEIRAAVFERAGSNCELCISVPATELHHLEGGSGRRALQAVSNCMATCRQCHRFFHNAPETYRQLVLTWAADYGYPVPRRFRGEPKAVA